MVRNGLKALYTSSFTSVRDIRREEIMFSVVERVTRKGKVVQGYVNGRRMLTEHVQVKLFLGS